MPEGATGELRGPFFVEEGTETETDKSLKNGAMNRPAATKFDSPRKLRS